MYVAPEPTSDVDTVEKRFVMPNVSLIQIVLIVMVLMYAYSARKMNGVVVGTIALTITLLHFYDHMYRVQRDPERAFFLPKKEKYGCQSCK
jgi:hypothetical protein